MAQEERSEQATDIMRKLRTAQIQRAVPRRSGQPTDEHIFIVSSGIPAPSTRYTSPDVKDRYSPSRGFDQEEANFLKELAEGVLVDPTLGPMISILNQKLEQGGEYITVVGGKYAKRDLPARRGGADTFRARQ